MRRSTVWLMLCGLIAAGGVAPGCSTTESKAPLNLKCAADADCALSCVAARGDCCVAPCGCTIAMHRAEKAAIEGYNSRHCASADYAKCPTVGGCEPLTGPALSARCVAGACVAERGTPPP